MKKPLRDLGLAEMGVRAGELGGLDRITMGHHLASVSASPNEFHSGTKATVS